MNQLQKIDLERAYWQRERLKLTHPLRQLFWECTLRCNLACRHCGSDCKAVSDSPEMPFEDFARVLDEVKAHQPHVKTMVHTVGGEPLVRQDLLECGRRITEKGFYWSMVSNGMLIDGPMMRELKRAGLRSLAIDVDGTKEDHNWLRCNEHSYDRVFNAIGHIRRTPHLVWDVITCVNHRNLPHLPELKRLLIEAGVTQWRCFTIVPMGRAKGQEDLLLSDEEFRQLMDFIVETRRENKIRLSYACEGFLGDYEERVRGHIYTCIAGLTVASVLSDGGISGCLSIRSSYQQGNIYKDSFWDVWQNRFQKYRNREWMRTGLCADCTLFRHCEGNGFHLRDDEGNLMLCHYQKLFGTQNIGEK